VGKLKVIHLKLSNRESNLHGAKPCVMALGFFDGVHLGHQEVINKAKAAAVKRNLPLVVMSFFPHPKEVISKGNKMFPYLMPMDEKEKKLEILGVQIFYLVHFDREFAALSPEKFVKNYLLDFGAELVVAGFDFTYGRNGEGNMDRMIADAKGLLNVIKVGKIEFAGEKISSTMIRNLICSGKVEQIPSFLGEPYQIEGTVLWNKEDVNVYIHPNYLLPSSGIYNVTVSNGYKTYSQEALVCNGKLKLIISKKGNFSFSNHEIIRIYWRGKLTKEWSHLVDQVQQPLESLMS
jgi:riboflavin kinase/FMN adenylyltransferase